jgi:hypothetical protein
MRKASNSIDAASADIDEKYWREAILQKSYYRGDIGFDRYRWALRYGQMARKQHGNKTVLKDVLTDLADGWSKFGGPSGLTWEEACDAVRDAWDHTDVLVADAIANQAGFKSPPTFAEHGSLVPRNVDEPNT